MEIRLRAKTLFSLYLKMLKPDLVCDVGSMDASEALFFRKKLPAARIVLFEGNKENFSDIKLNNDVAMAEIDTFNKVVSNENGVRPFYQEQASSVAGENDHLKGMSSLMPRKAGGISLGSRMVPTPSIRLDTFIEGLKPEPELIALWIDVEGAAYEVLAGAEAIKGKVGLIHIEVETKEFWQGQKLKSEVVSLAERFGFVVLGAGWLQEQHDLVLLNRNIFEPTPWRFRLLAYGVFFLSLREGISKRIKNALNKENG